MRIKAYTHDGKACVVRFTSESGNVLSIGFGEGHYCEARDGIGNPRNAEIAVWHRKEGMKRIGNDKVAGWVDLSHLPRLLDMLDLQDGADKIAEYLSNL